MPKTDAVAEQEPFTLQTLESMQDEFLQHWGDSQGFAKKTVESAWLAGVALLKVNKRLPHGRWQKWLDAVGVGHDTARRLLKIAELEKAQIASFDSMGAALASLKPPRETPALVVNNPGGRYQPAPPGVDPFIPPDPVEDGEYTPAPADKVVPVDGDPNGYEVANEVTVVTDWQPTGDGSAGSPVFGGDNDPPPPADIQDVGTVSETDTYRFRAEEAERQRDDLAMQLAELQDRVDVVVASDSDDSRASDIMRETETATAATERARAALTRAQAQLDRANKKIARFQKRLTAIKQDMLFKKPMQEILMRHFKVTDTKADDEGEGDA